METDKDDALMDIDDPRVPHVVRDHGRRFRKPAKYVEDHGFGEYVLFAADGEVLDLIALT